MTLEVAEKYHWVGIDLGNVPCDLSCKYCSVRQGTGDSHPPKSEDIYNLFNDHIIPFLPFCRVFVFVSARSEPTLNQEALVTLKQISKYSGFRFHLLTNGTKINRIRDLARLGWIITVSYDGIEQVTNRPFRKGTNSCWTVKSTIRQLVEMSATFSVRATVTNWDNFEKTVCDVKNLGCKFLEVLENLGMGCGEKISSTQGDVIKLVDVAIAHPEINIFTPITGSLAACPLAINGNRLNWVFQNKRWQTTYCFVDVDMETNATLRVKARWDGCLLKPMNKQWRDISQHSVLVKGYKAWEKQLASR